MRRVSQFCETRQRDHQIRAKLLARTGAHSPATAGLFRPTDEPRVAIDS
jgi:hypothetical protein